MARRTTKSNEVSMKSENSIIKQDGDLFEQKSDNIVIPSHVEVVNYGSNQDDSSMTLEHKEGGYGEKLTPDEGGYGEKLNPDEGGYGEKLTPNEGGYGEKLTPNEGAVDLNEHTNVEEPKEVDNKDVKNDEKKGSDEKKDVLSDSNKYKIDVVIPGNERSNYRFAPYTNLLSCFVKNKVNIKWLVALDKAIRNKDSDLICFVSSYVPVSETGVKIFLDKMIKGKKIDFSKKSSYISMSRERILIFILKNKDNMNKLNGILKGATKSKLVSARSNIVLTSLIQDFK